MRAKLENDEIIVLGQEKCCSMGVWNISARKATIHGNILLGDPGAKTKWVTRYCYRHVDEGVELLRGQFKGEYLFAVTRETSDAYSNDR